MLYLYLPPKKRYTFILDICFFLGRHWHNSWESFLFQIEAEASSVQAVAATLCPLNIVLDRVVLTSTGVLLGCWQVNFHNLKDHTYPWHMYYRLWVAHMGHDSLMLVPLFLPLLSLSHTHTYTLSLSLSLTHTQTHTLAIMMSWSDQVVIISLWCKVIKNTKSRKQCYFSSGIIILVW